MDSVAQKTIHKADNNNEVKMSSTGCLDDSNFGRRASYARIMFSRVQPLVGTYVYSMRQASLFLPSLSPLEPRLDPNVLIRADMLESSAFFATFEILRDVPS